MKKVSISEARQPLSSLIRDVAHGESFLITRSGIPIAELPGEVETGLTNLGQGNIFPAEGGGHEAIQHL